MLLIPCPHCGERDEAEFAYGGPARLLPPLDGSGDVAAWHRAVHLPAVSEGPLRELWYHHAGCECWIEVVRDIRSHDVPEVGE
ncbi:MAG: sarcosine oxidase subunit delta [Albidovulum sp.]